MVTNLIVCYFLSLHDDDDGAAQVDVEECTKEPTAYIHPKYPNVKFWDLPGIGTENHPDLVTYRQKVQLDKYHTYLIFASSRFTKNDIILAREIKKQGKSFFFIRTKIDEDVRAEKRKKSFNEYEVLLKIRRNCKENLVDEAGNPISGENDIFLISNHDPEKWDFSRLTEAILDALPRYKREALTMSLNALTSLSKDILKRKVQILYGRMILVAAASGGVAAIPVPGLSIPVDAVLIFNEISEYMAQLGIPLEGSKIFEAVSFVTRKAIVDMHLTFSSKANVLSLFAKEAATGVAAEEISRFIPVVGQAIAATLSFGCTIIFLRSCLKKIEKVALTVLEEASQRSVDNLDRE